jgi:hypothetical protein
MHLAERGTFLGGKVWVREIRKQTESGHQSSVLSTDYRSDAGPVAAAMFARWSQENFFKYMRKHYGLDSLLDYATEEIPDTTRVVNPAYRRLDGQVRSLRGHLTRKLAAFSAMGLKGEIKPENVAAFEQKKAALQEQIEAFRTYALTAGRNCGLRYSLPEMKLLTNEATTSLYKSRCHW